MTSPKYRVYVRDAAFLEQDEVSDWLSLTYIKRANGVGTWTMELSAKSVSLPYFTRTAGIVVYRDGEVDFSGSIATEYVLTETSLRVAGYDDNYLLRRRVVLPTPSGPPYPDEYYVYTDLASTVMRQIVHLNVGPGARVDRRVTNFTIPLTDPLLGDTLTARGRFQYVLDLLVELALSDEAGGLLFTCLQSSDGNHVEFLVSEPRDRTDEITFSIEAGTIQSFSDAFAQPQATAVIVLLGDGLGGNRSVLEAGDATAIFDYGLSEAVIDARDVTDPGEGNQRLAEALAGVVASRRITVAPFETQSLEYGSDAENGYLLGDLVATEINGIRETRIIRQVQVDLTPDRGAVVTPTIADATATDDDDTVEGWAGRQIDAVGRRVSNLERNYGIPDDSVSPAMLATIDVPADGEVYVYDSATGLGEWVSALTLTSLTVSGTSGLGVVTASGTITGSSTVQGTRLISTIATGTAPLTVSSTTVVPNLNVSALQGHPASDFALASALSGYLTLTGGTLTGPLTIAPSSATTSALVLKGSGSSGLVTLGATNAATPDLVVQNNGGTQTARLTTAGVLIVGTATSAVSGAGQGDIHCNDIFLVNGSNFRRLLAAGSNFQISNDGNTGNDMTIDSSGLMTIPALQVDNNDVTLGVNRIAINGTGVGFFGATPIGRPTVTGAKGGSPALTSLCSQLANLGLITDLTS